MKAKKKAKKTVAETDVSLRKVAQSMRQAFTWWGIPINVQKKAKADGCPAFVEHRVHREELLEWIEKNPDSQAEDDSTSSAEELKRQKLLNEVAILRIKVAKEEGTSMSKEQVKAEWARCMAIVHEEARNVINDDDRYRTFCNRLKAGIEGGEDQ